MADGRVTKPLTAVAPRRILQGRSRRHGPGRSAAEVRQGNTPGEGIDPIFLEATAGSREELCKLLLRPCPPPGQGRRPPPLSKMQGSFTERSLNVIRLSVQTTIHVPGTVVPDSRSGRERARLGD